MGVTLGKSTKQQVKNMLVQKGYKINTEPDGSYAIETNNLPFGGGYWTYVNFEFVNGRLVGVWFQNNERDSPVNIDNSYEKLRNTLYDKYSQYYLNLPSDEPNIKYIDFSDGSTFVTLSIRTYDFKRFISLGYEDEKLKSLKLKNEFNEL